MKKKDLQSLRSKSAGELGTLVADLRGQSTKLKMEMAMRRIKNTNAVRNTKRSLAQVLTILREKQLVASSK